MLVAIGRTRVAITELNWDDVWEQHEVIIVVELGFIPLGVTQPVRDRGLFRGPSGVVRAGKD
ncbi:hypothetical protein BN12_60028 [Nostocoides japonicum T1-X7]|uniref:Uncharacterized protein n=1 Tax=Nostocoides japonicum T1-X7 TaxID=1194083 RepID=A0A077M419_9MICO|nr:hypothetical protein BN12_60028 [Tetrasphaera japonica T1-X7]